MASSASDRASPRCRLRVAAILAAISLAAPARAAPPDVAPAPHTSPRDAARARAEQGLKLFVADRFAEAYEAFREADALYHAPTLVLQEARCLRKLGRLREARDMYARVLDEPLSPMASRAFVDAHRDAEAEIERVRAAIPTLTVVVRGAGAAVAVISIDGDEVKAAAVELDPGHHTLVVRAGSAPRFERIIELAEGATVHMEVTLDPPPFVAPSPPPPRPRSSPRWPLAAAFGLAAGAALAGTSTGAASFAKGHAVRAHCAGTVCPTAYRADAERAAVLGDISTGAFVTAGVGVAAGTVLLLLRGRY